MQNLFSGFATKEAEFFIGEVLQPYYLILYLFTIILIRLLTKEEIGKIAAFVLWGYWTIVFWPLIDKIILGDKFYISFYFFAGPAEIFQRLVTFFGPVESVGILYGTRIEMVLIMLITFLYVYFKKGQLIRALGGALGVYVLFFITCALPSLITFLVSLFLGKGLFSVEGGAVAKLFISPLHYFGGERGFSTAFFYKLTLFYNLILLGGLIWLQFLLDRSKLWALIRNLRFPQTIFTLGLLFLGFFLAGYYYPDNLVWDVFSVLVVVNLALAVFFAWMFSVVVNDIEDLAVDEITNRERPLPQKIFSIEQYRHYGSIFLYLSLSFALAVSGKTFLLIVLYHFLTWIYSSEPFRLRRYLGVASLLSAFASLLLFLVGFTLVSDGQAVEQLPWRIVIFLLVSYSLLIPLKDIKDISGDRAAGIWTIPVLLGEEKARFLFSVLIFCLYFISVWVLRDRGLFFPALFFGGAAYLLTNSKKILHRNLLFWNLLLVFFFGLVVVFRTVG